MFPVTVTQLSFEQVTGSADTNNHTTPVDSLRALRFTHETRTNRTALVDAGDRILYSRDVIVCAVFLKVVPTHRDLFIRDTRD